MARAPATRRHLERERVGLLTAERIKQAFPHLIRGKVTRYELPRLSGPTGFAERTEFDFSERIIVVLL
jgi:hypothetical protein